MNMPSAHHPVSNPDQMNAARSRLRSMGGLTRCLQRESARLMKALGVCGALCLLTFSTSTFSTSTFAADAVPAFKAPMPKTIVPRSGLFIGFGGSSNSVKLERDLFAVGLSEVFVGTTLVARGYAEGPANPFHDANSKFTPEAQAGFFGHFADSNWLWGVKFKYKNLKLTSTERDVIVPQIGSFTAVGGGPSGPLTGNVLIQSIQTSINHELALLAFLGHSFMNSTVYLGAGPALSGTKSDINRAVGFGNVNGTPTDITGAPASFSSSKWVWGTAAQIGMTYTFAPTWFLDLNYTYVITERFETNYAAPFLSTSAGLIYTGNAYIATSQRLTSQAFAVSINKAF
jgi:opacity protein-like surface antigen